MLAAMKVFFGCVPAKAMTGSRLVDLDRAGSMKVSPTLSTFGMKFLLTGHLAWLLAPMLPHTGKHKGLQITGLKN